VERYQVPEEDAFAVLRKSSQDHNLKLRDIARTLHQTEQLPGAR
jgi:AmiR/NasT family two-component response regulator